MGIPFLFALGSRNSPTRVVDARTPLCRGTTITNTSRGGGAFLGCPVFFCSFPSFRPEKPFSFFYAPRAAFFLLSWFSFCVVGERTDDGMCAAFSSPDRVVCGRLRGFFSLTPSPSLIHPYPPSAVGKRHLSYCTRTLNLCLSMCSLLFLFYEGQIYLADKTYKLRCFFPF